MRSHSLFEKIFVLSIVILIVAFVVSIAPSLSYAKGAGNGASGAGDGGVGAPSGGGRSSVSSGDDSGIAGPNAGGTVNGAVNHSDNEGNARPVSVSSVGGEYFVTLTVNGDIEYSADEPATYTLRWTSPASVTGCRSTGDSAGGKWRSPSGSYNLPRSGSQVLSDVTAGEYFHTIYCRGSYVASPPAGRDGPDGGRAGEGGGRGALMDAVDRLNFLAQSGSGGDRGLGTRINFTTYATVFVDVSPNGLDEPSVSLEVAHLDQEDWTSNLTITAGEDVRLRWSSSNATRCLGTQFTTSDRTTGTETDVTEPAGGDRTYTIRCYNGATNAFPSATDTARVSAGGGPTISAGPSLVDACETTTISWNVYEIGGCTITGSDNRPFGPETLSGEGSATSYPVCGQYTYTLFCPDVGVTSVQVRPRILIEEI